MEETIFSAKDVEKHFRKKYTFTKVHVLKGIQLDIHRGDIYGFVGENGAGKTTLMRILTGRVRQDGGEIALFGETGEKKLPEKRGHIGAMIEKPAFFPNMTAWDNLEVLRLQRGIKEKKYIEEALDMTGLTGDAAWSKKVKTFSLGMKQRLGLAMAFFSNPEFLVLDEPVNGLDPEGIVSFRETLKRLNQERGVTILISSHLLGELDQLATCYGFIRHGRMLEQITAEELHKKCRTCLSIIVDNSEKAAGILQGRYPGCEIKIISERVIRLYDYSGNTGAVTKELVAGEVEVREIKADSGSLEEYYMSLMQK